MLKNYFSKVTNLTQSDTVAAIKAARWKSGTGIASILGFSADIAQHTATGDWLGIGFLLGVSALATFMICMFVFPMWRTRLADLVVFSFSLIVVTGSLNGAQKFMPEGEVSVLTALVGDRFDTLLRLAVENEEDLDKISGQVDVVQDSLRRTIYIRDRECLHDVAEHLVNVQTDSKPLKVEFTATCKEILFQELSQAEYFANQEHSQRHNMLGELIKIAQNNPLFDQRDIAKLYLYRGLYGWGYNRTASLNDLVSAYRIDHNLPSAILRLLKIYQELGGERFKVQKPAIDDLFRQTTQEFPWHIAHVHLGTADRIVEILDHIENGTDVTRENFSSPEITQAYLRAFRSLDEQNSYFSIATKIELAMVLTLYPENNELADLFVQRHGNCDALKHIQNIGDCYRLMFLVALNNKSGDVALSYKNLAALQYKSIGAVASLVDLFLITEEMTRSSLGVDTSKFDRTPTQLEAEVKELILMTEKTGDVIRQASLELFHANQIIGFLRQDHELAHQLQKNAISLYGDYLGAANVKKIRAAKAWRELKYGDKEEALNLLQLVFDNQEFQSEYSRWRAQWILQSQYREAGSLEIADDLYQKLRKEIRARVEKITDIDTLVEFIPSLDSLKQFDISGEALEQLGVLARESDKTQQQLNTIKYLTSIADHLRAVIYSYRHHEIELDDDHRSAVLADLRDVDKRLMSMNLPETSYVKRHFQKQKIFFDSKGAVNKSAKTKFEDSVELGNAADGILNATKRHYSKFPENISQSEAGLRCRLAGNAAIKYIEEYLKPFDFIFVDKDDQKNVQIFSIVEDITEDERESLEAALYAWDFCYEKDAPFDSYT